jgi:hypothetical protein
MHTYITYIGGGGGVGTRRAPHERRLSWYLPVLGKPNIYYFLFYLLFAYLFLLSFCLFDFFSTPFVSSPTSVG